MGQAYHYNAAQIRELRNEIVSRLITCCEAFAETAKRCNTIATTDAMQGQGADKIKEYLSIVHSSVLCGSFCGLAELILEGILEYETQYHNLDSSIDAVIDTAELDEIKTSLNKMKESFASLSKSFTSLSTSVADITAYRYMADRSGLSEDIDSATEYIEKVVQGIDSIENAPFCIETAAGLLDRINERIHDGTWLSLESFDRTAYLSTVGYAAFYDAVMLAKNELDEYDLTAAEREKAITEIEEGWKERAEKAEKIKQGIVIFETVAIIVVSVTAGSGIALIVSTATGAINGAVSESVTQWSSGTAAADEGYDYWRIETKACFGALRSVANTAISEAFGAACPGSFGGKIRVNIGEEFVTNVVDTGFDLAEAWYYDEWDEETERVFTEEYWTELITKSAVTGGTKTIVKEAYKIYDKAVEKPVVFRNNAGVKTGLKTILGMEKKLVSKSLGDITDYVIETSLPADEEGYLDFSKIPSKEEWEQGLKETFSKIADKAGERAAAGALESAAPEIVAHKTKYQTKIAVENGNGVTIYRRKTENSIEAIDTAEDETGAIVINDIRTIPIYEQPQKSKHYTDYEKELIQGKTSTAKAGTKTATKLLKKCSKQEYDTSVFDKKTLFADIPVPINNNATELPINKKKET